MTSPFIVEREDTIAPAGPHRRLDADAESPRCTELEAEYVFSSYRGTSSIADGSRAEGARTLACTYVHGRCKKSCL
ncbi:hypothetical protein GCM10009739_12790 [Microbacterium ulmi]